MSSTLLDYAPLLLLLVDTPTRISPQIPALYPVRSDPTRKEINKTFQSACIKVIN